MSATYIVERVVGEPRDWDSKFGPMKSYTLALHGQSEVVELSQKPDRQPPSEGDEIEGEIVPSNGNFPPKLKRAKPQGGGNWSGGGMSPEREKRIASLANWKVAPDVVRLANELGISVKDAYERCKVVKEALDKDAGV